MHSNRWQHIRIQLSLLEVSLEAQCSQTSQLTVAVPLAHSDFVLFNCRWKPRQIDTISFRAVEMLYSPRQLMYYWNDMDLPW
jgi:hypothetical protein